MKSQKETPPVLCVTTHRIFLNTNIFHNFVSKSNKHNNGTIYIQLFTLYRTAVDVILRLLFFVCKDSRKENFQKLSPLPTDYGYSHAATFGKLFGTFLFWYPIQECGFFHTDEHVHILPVLFSVQLGIDNVA